MCGGRHRNAVVARAIFREQQAGRRVWLDARGIHRTFPKHEKEEE